MKTKNKIDAHILRISAAALLFLCIIVAHSSARADCLPPPNGLVSWWPGDGNANDIVSGNNGALQNGATFTAGVGQAFLLSKGDAFVQVPNAPGLNPTGSFS